MSTSSFALDVSGSMEGLIESAKQRLWDITNELAQARPVAAAARRDLELRRARATASRPGYVRVDLPFTADLDAVNATLFAFQTEAATSTSARAIQTVARHTAVEPGSRRVASHVRRRQRIRGARSAADDRAGGRRGGAPRHRRQRDLLRRRRRRRRARAGDALRRARTACMPASISMRRPSRTSRRRSTTSSRR